MAKPFVFRRTSKILAVSVVSIFGAAGVAQAASISTTGAYAFNTGYSQLTVRDTADDNHAAYANWNDTKNNRVETGNYAGAQQVIKPSIVTDFRACRDRGTLLPDNCSDWQKSS